MDTDFENEKLRISEFMIENLDGKVMRSWGPSTEYIDYKLIRPCQIILQRKNQ